MAESTPDHHFDFRNIDYGFRWGPAEVTRMISDPKLGVLLGLDTAKHQVQIAVSPAGRSVRIWVDNVRYVPKANDA